MSVEEASPAARTMQDVTVHRIMGRTPERDADGEGDAEVHRLRCSLDEARKQELRLLADFQNLRRRIAREQGTLKHEGKREALSALLPVLDAFERALKAGSSDRGFYDGMAATHGLFVEALRRLGPSRWKLRAKYSIRWCMKPSGQRRPAASGQELS
ncbi:MAG TPA: nucleotide exchange factor GrpE [Vicinamibacterales bacterium]|nr:nucleotide exchange factor GrpE [Vicinamibacterales bacterium]